MHALSRQRGRGASALPVHASLLTALVWVVGCGAAGDGPDATNVDAGFEPGLVDDDAGNDAEADTCTAMLDRVCGPGGTTCLDSGGCQAALLIARYERDRCAEALGDTFVYPSCEADACARLVDKVCGENDACAAGGACQQAKSFDTQLNDPAQDDGDREAARDACGAALVDDVVFALCD